MDDTRGGSGKRAIAVIAAMVGGTLVAVQSRINGELGQRLDDGFAAALVSFGTGLVILLVALLVWAPGRAGIARVRAAIGTGELVWWMLLGGAAGALLVLTQGLVAATLGVALFSVATVAGQTIGSLVVDLVGLTPGGKRPLTRSRGIGALLAIAAVIWAVSGQLSGDVPLWMLVLPFLAGLGLGWQQAVNGRVRDSAGSALTATVGNFVVGTTALAIAFVVHGLVAGWPQALPAEPWLYLGGVIGCAFIAASAVLVRLLGSLLLSLSMIAGQLAASVLIDAILPGGAGLTSSTVAGAALALVAVAIAGIRIRGRARRRVT